MILMPCQTESSPSNSSSRKLPNSFRFPLFIILGALILTAATSFGESMLSPSASGSAPSVLGISWPRSLFAPLLSLFRRSTSVESPTASSTATATATSSGGDQLTVANPILPSIQGFGTDKIVGASTVSYPIAVPAGTGGLTPSLSLSYSSRAVDDQHNDQLCWNTYFNNQSSLAGLGWDLGGLGYIARDPGENKGSSIINEWTKTGDLEDDRYFLVFPGGSAELINDNRYSTIEPGTPAAEQWRTVPETFLKIKHNHLGGGRFDDGMVKSCKTVWGSGYIGYDTDQWEVTAKDGTKYYFGSPADMAQVYKGRFCNDDACSQIFATSTEQTNPDPTGAGDVLLNQNMDGGAIPDPNLATEYGLAQCDEHCSGESSCGWSLNRLVPQKWHLRKIVDTHGNSIEIKYEARVKKAQRSSYEGGTKEDNCPIETWGSPCPNFYTHEIRPVQVLYGKNVNVTGDTYKMKVDLNYESRNDYQTVSSYFGEDENDPIFKCRIDKDYDDVKLVTSFSKARLSGIDVKVSDRLVRRYGLTYSYGDPGGLKQKDEGAFGGHSLLTDITQYGTNGTSSLPAYHFTYAGSGPQIYLQRADNGYSGAVEFTYEDVYPKVCQYKDNVGCADGSYGEVKNGVNCFKGRGVIRKRLDNKRVYDGMGGNFKVEYAYSGSPAAAVRRFYPIVDDNHCSNGAFTEFKLLGHEWVTETLYALNNDAVKVSKSKSYYYDKLANADGRFKPDPRSGAEWKTEALDPNNGDALLTRSVSTIKPDDLTYTTVPDPHGWNYFIRTTRVDNTIGGKTSRVTYDLYDSYGNLKQTHLWGDVGSATDDRYQFTEYAYNLDKWILGQPVESYLSDQPSGGTIYQHTYNWYDVASSACGASRQTTIPDKGQLRCTIAVESDGRSPALIKTTFDEYDQWGNLLRGTGPRGETARTVYEGTYHLYPTDTYNALNQHVQTTYDYVLGVPTRVTDTNGQSTDITYDTFGRRTRVLGPTWSGKRPETLFEYYDRGEKGAPVSALTKVKKDDGSFLSATVHYNGLGQSLQAQSEWENGNAVVTNTTYNSLGKTERVSLPYSVTGAVGNYRPPDWTVPYSSTTYDALGRALVATNPDGTSSRNEYRDWTVTAFDTNGNKSLVVNDAFGKPVRAASFSAPSDSSPYSVFTSFYDILGNPVVSDGLLGYHAYANYDTLGRKYETGDPDLGLAFYRYDESGNLVWSKDAKNQEFNYQFDLLNRPISTTLPDGSRVATTYDTATLGVGKPAQTEKFKADGSLHSRRSVTGYDELGRVPAERFDYSGYLENATTRYTYDLLGNVKVITYPDGEAVTNSYDGLNRLVRVAGKDEYVKGIVYTPQGEIASFTSGDGKTTTYTYNSQNRRLERINSDLLNYSYTHDNVGNIKTWTGAAANSITFDYDHLYRLRSVTGGLTAGYAYDELGRMSTKNEATNLSLAYDSLFPLHAPKTVAGTAYQYDANGNLETDGIRSLTWNSEGQPSRIELTAQAAAASGAPESVPAGGAPESVPAGSPFGDLLGTATEDSAPFDDVTQLEIMLPWLHREEGVAGFDRNGDGVVNSLDLFVKESQRVSAPETPAEAETPSGEETPATALATPIIMPASYLTNLDYDGGGSRILREVVAVYPDGKQTTTERKVYVNQYFAKDVLSGAIEKYYFAGGKRVAERTVIECDSNVTACGLSACRDNLCGGGSCWLRGGEVAASTCCGDDTGEFFITSYCSGSGVGKCCDAATDKIDSSGNCVASCPVPSLKAFVSSVKYTGNLGGLFGADAKCQALATAAKLPGPYKAWLSDSRLNAKDRFLLKNSPYKTVTGTKVVDNFADLIDGSLDSALKVTEKGVTLTSTSERTWTGTSATGTKLLQTCSDWKSATASVIGSGGQVTSTSAWSSSHTSGCILPYRLYCLQDGF